MVGTRTRGRRRAGTKALLAIAHRHRNGRGGRHRPGGAQRLRPAQPRIRSTGRGGGQRREPRQPVGALARPEEPSGARTTRPARRRSTTARSAEGTWASVPLVVPIQGGAPTGTVFDPTTAFPVPDGTSTVAPRFLFASRPGTSPPGRPAPRRRDRSDAAALYTGMAPSTNATKPLLYAADFAGRKIDVWNGNFDPQWWPGAFTDPDLPSGFSPFNVQALGKRVYVAYAKLDKATGEEGRATTSATSASTRAAAYCSTASSTRQAERAVGSRDRPEGLRAVLARPARGQLRQRLHQRLRQAHG